MSSKWPRSGNLVPASLHRHLSSTAGGAGTTATAAAAASADSSAGGVGGPLAGRAGGAYIGLFLLMVTVWSAILISAVFSLRVNREACEACPVGCSCRDVPPAWG